MDMDNGWQRPSGSHIVSLPRITPTAMPSIASVCASESTTIGSKSGFSAISSTVPPAGETLDRHLVIEPSNDNLAVARFAAAVHGEQIPVQNAGIDHRQAAHAQEKVGTRLEQAGHRPYNGAVRFPPPESGYRQQRCRSAANRVVRPGGCRVPNRVRER
jgi:hypothetical protein